MKPDHVALVATVVLLLPMISLLFAAPVFLVVKLDNPPIALLLRGLFAGCLLAVAIVAIGGAIAIAVSGRPIVAIGFGVIAAFAIWSRRWFLPQWDARQSELEAGDASAVRQLRRLHLRGMLHSAIQFAVFVACIPYIVVTA